MDGSFEHTKVTCDSTLTGPPPGRSPSNHGPNNYPQPRDVSAEVQPRSINTAEPTIRQTMSAPGIPNLLSLRGGPRLRGSRGRGRGRGSGHPDAQQRNDIDIQSTDTDAAVSRLSAVSMDYLDDQFASYFVNGPGTRRLPIINRGRYYLLC